MHACEIADRLDIRTVMVPRYAGVLSALGMLVADATRDYSASVLTASHELTPGILKESFAPLLARGARELAAEGFAPKQQRLERLIDVRYVGQSYEITLPFSPAYRRDFDRVHGRLYGYSNPQRPTEVVAVRVKATGVTAKPRLPFAKPRTKTTPKPAAVRPGRFGGRKAQVSFYRWENLQPGARAAGPAVITGAEATIVVPPAFRFMVDGFLNVVCVRA
jgi:N-methylhydantoinase A/oxoprolinase/acetone carboxylase beta subunit